MAELPAAANPPALNPAVELSNSPDPDSANEPPQIEKVDVDMLWNDFISSLEELRHSPFQHLKKRFWYRIDSLKVVFLGCESVLSGGPKVDKIGSVRVRMENLRPFMVAKPRIWGKVIELLCRLCEDEAMDSGDIERAFQLLSRVQSFRSGAEGDPKIRYFAMNCQLLTFRLVLPLAERLLKQKKGGMRVHLSTTLDEFMRVIEPSQQAVLRIRQDISKGSGGSKETPRPVISFVKQFLERSGLGQEIPIEFQSICLSVLLFDEVTWEFPVQELLTAANIDLLLDTQSYGMKESPSDGYCQLSFLLELIWILQVISQTNRTDAPSTIISQLCEQTRTWKEKVNQPQKFQASIKLVEVCAQVILTEGLEEAENLIQAAIPVLIQYSLEGYLSSEPDGFLTKVLELLCVSVESLEMDPGERAAKPHEEFLRVIFPNVFSEVFGFDYDLFSDSLLEFATNALFSKKRKTLLREGLHQIVDIARIFKPRDFLLAAHAKEEINQMVAELLNDILEAAMNTEIPQPTRSNRKKNLIAFFGESPSQQDLDPDRASHSLIAPASIKEYVKMNAQASPAQKVEKKERALILSLLLKTGSALVKKNEDLSYLIASVLPQLLSHLKFWEANIRLVVISLLKFGVVGMESGELKWFQIYGVILPKLIKRVDSLGEMQDAEKASLLSDISQFLIDKMEQQIDVSELATYGLDLLFNTRPSHSTTGIKEAISMLTKNFASPTQSSLLLLLQTDFDFIRNNLPEEHAESSKLFYYFLLRGRRAEIRSFHHICKPAFAETRFKKIRSLLYRLPEASFQETAPAKAKAKAQDPALGSSRVFLLTELVLSLLGIRETPLSNILIGPVLDAVEDMVSRPFTETDTALIKKQLRKIDIFSVVREQTAEEDPAKISGDFQGFFPPEILNSDTAFHKLGLMAERLQAAQAKYGEIKSMAVTAISTFVAPLGAPNQSESLLKQRVQAMNKMLLELPQNQAELKRLAFSQNLWDTPLEIRVQTNGAHNDGESFKNALRGCFLGLIDIMKELLIKELSWRGKLVDPETFFNLTPTEVRPTETPAPPLDPDDIANNPNHPHNNSSNNLMTIEELKGRRAFAVRAIEQKMKDSPRQNPVLVDCKMEILMEEERLEAEYQRQKAQPLQPKDFTARLNIFLFDTADCCDTHIIGCYAPGQIHCEKPVEIGLRANGGFLSIYSQQDGVELENSEVVFTDQGLYLYKAYSNGHVYDTSMIWLHLFKTLLSPPYSLPAIIVPRGFPTFITYELLTKYISPELTGSQLSWKKDFYERTEIYLDFAIERVKGGFDLILTPENLSDISALIQGTEQEKDLSIPNQKVRSMALQRDLAGIVYEHVISSIVSHHDPEIQELKVLGRPISAFVSQYIETGVASSKILADGLDFPRFARGKKRYDPISKNPEMLSQVAREVVEKLVKLIDEKIDDWCANLDLETFFQTQRAPFFEFQKFLEQSTSLPARRNRRAEVKACLEASVLLVTVSAFPVRYQLELMRWIFKNEDKVWRFRGGRDRHETVEDFLQFVETTQGPTPTKYPGVVAFALLGSARSLPPNPDHLEAFSLQNIVGYAVGEYILLEKSDMATYQRAKPEKADSAGVCYEIVTAWVDARFRGLAISPDMYSEVMRQVGRLRKCDSILFDLQKGGLEKVISRSWIFWALGRLRLLPWIIRTREDSYTIDNTLTKREEAFEQVIVNARAFSWATWTTRIFHSIGSLLTSWTLFPGSPLWTRKGK